MNNWFKAAGMALVAGTIGVVALVSIASAQGPGPTTVPNSQTTPGTQTAPGWGMGYGFGKGFGFGFGEMHEFGARGGNSLFVAFARSLGMTETDLLTELRAGKSLNELAQAKSVNTASVISDYLKPIQDQLTQAVTDKLLTQAQADARLAVHKADAEALLDRKFDANSFPQRPQDGQGNFGQFGPRGFGHGGPRGGGQAPQQQQQQQQVPQGTQQSN